MKKQKFNINEAEGRRDGLTGNGIHLAIKFNMLKNMREKYHNAPIMVIYEENYKTYKDSFLKSFWQVKKGL